MTDYVTASLYVYGPEGEEFRETVENNNYGTVISSFHLEQLLHDQESLLENIHHVVVCARLAGIKEIFRLASENGFSVGILPLSDQKQLKASYALPDDPHEALSLALSTKHRDVDLVLCNNKILMFKGSVGRVPLIDSSERESKLEIIRKGLTQLRSLHLLPFKLETLGNNKIKLSTAACGFLLFENPEKSFATKLVADDFSDSDKMISMVVVAPFSIMAYLHLMLVRLFSRSTSGGIPDSVGYIKSPHFTVESELELNVRLDGEVETCTPLECRVAPGAVRVNHGRDASAEKSPGKEKAVTRSLPDGKEVAGARGKRVPFFTYASEERFKELFVSLREDARIDSTYITLMCLSTILATVGLYLNSSSVIIGAMVLAPLMAPIISMAMSLLRYDRKLFWDSFYKICLGISIAILISFLFTYVSPYQPFTNEMKGRLNPTMLDLYVAIAAGIAGAYTKSYKEILQSLAGVAIAVALVPPLAVAGIGLGRLDLLFFGHAFLLFLTNLVGIILAATFTFRVLGFSPIVRDRKGVIVVLLFFLIIFTPLYMAFTSIVEKTGFEQSWKHERFLVNGKYLIVNKAELHEFRDRNVLVVEIHAREPLDRYDLNVFKKKVQQNFSEKLLIRANIVYIP